MSLSNRRAFLLGLAALPLAGCGYQPAHGTRGAASAALGNIRIQDPTDEAAFELVEQLERRLPGSGTPTHELRYTISTNRRRLAVTEEEITTGYNLNGRVDFQIVDLRDQSIATQGSVSNFSTYSATANTVAARASERDARRRLMVILADYLTARLIATSGTWAT